MGKTLEITAKAKEFCAEVGGAKKILLIGHTNPDGDSIGSLTGMKHYLSALLPSAKVKMAVPTDFPAFLKFLDSNNEILVYKHAREEIDKCVTEADLIICLDFNGLKRIDDLGKTIGSTIEEKKKKIMLIDHHPQPDDIFDFVLSETEVSSTCELVYYLLKEAASLTGCKLPIECSTSLYAGMMTDTNNFANSVFPSTFRMASELIAAGVEKEEIQFKVLNCYTENRMRLMGEMLLNQMTVYPQYKAAVMILDKKTKDKFDYKDGDTEGFVNLPLTIEGIEISALFTESDDFIRVSLRSRGSFSVNAFSRSFFNGGGHERAAGGRVYMPIGEVKKYFEDALRHTFC